jgi:hypothetical protein
VLDPPVLRSLTPTPDAEYPETYRDLVEFGQRISSDLEPVTSDEFGGVFRFVEG